MGSLALTEPVSVSVLMNLFDWTILWGTWGRPGVYYILDRAQQAGVQRIYVRVRHCQCYYATRVDVAAATFDEDSIPVRFPQVWHMTGTEWKWINRFVDFGEFDPVPVFIQGAREMGMEVYAFLEHVEEHGWGWPSRFMQQHPEFLTHNRVNQVVRGQLSYAYPQVIDYKLAILREVLEYGFDGVLLDFCKGGDHRFERFDERGYNITHYDPPALEAFKAKTGKDAWQIPNEDPEWVAFRAGYVTEYLRQARRLQCDLYPDIELGISGLEKGHDVAVKGWKDPNVVHRPDLKENPSPVAPLASALAGFEDHQTWGREDLLDYFISSKDFWAARDAPGFRSPDQVSETVAEHKREMPNLDRVGVWINTWALSGDELREASRIAARAGASEVFYFQGVTFQRNHTWPALRDVVHELCDNGRDKSR